VGRVDDLRFLRITKTAKWCEQVIDLMRNKKIALADLSSNLNGGLKQLYKMRPFLKRFGMACGKCDQLLKLLKCKGLNDETYGAACEIVRGMARNSILRRRTQAWLDDHIAIQKRLNMGAAPLPISSDIIESLMGKFKNIVQRCPRAEFNRLILLFPCLCGEINEEAIAKALITVSHGELKQYEKNNISTTMRQARRKLFEPVRYKIGGPISGN